MPLRYSHHQRSLGIAKISSVVGHEIAGIVAAVGRNVTKFKVGDKAGVGCMVDSCMQCGSCKKGEEHHCKTTGMLGTYFSRYALNRKYNLTYTSS